MCKPDTFSNLISYADKLELLQYLIDMVHDLDEFRSFLNKRIEEKSQLTKQKQDILSEIRQFENSKQDLIREHTQSDQASNQE